jgi:hypothetical protein
MFFRAWPFHPNPRVRFFSTLLFHPNPKGKVLLNIAIPSQPQGYDSVVGEVGEVLNYDEIVLYNHAGALPRYLVVYTIDDNPAYVDPNTEGELNGQAEDDILENGPGEGEFDGQAEDDILENGPGEGEFDGQAEDDILENGPGEGGALVSAVRDRKEDSAPSQP